MNEREQRIGHNEALFRHVNERLRDVNAAFGSLTGDFQIVCECGETECAEPIVMTEEEYKELRADPRWFAIVHGHRAADVEDVVERHENYEVVQKHPGPPTRLATSTEPVDR